METVSHSELSRWRSCQQAHHYAYVQRIEPKRKPKPVKMGFIIHELLELVALSEPWKPQFEKFARQFSSMFEEEKEFYGRDMPDQIKRIIEGYIRHWKDDPLEYLMVEEKIGPIPLTDETQLTGIPDGVVLDENDRAWLLERKTVSKIPAEPRLWEFQTILYVWALRKMGYELNGILWDFVRRKAPAVPQQLKSGELTKRKNLDTDRLTYKSAIEDHGLDPDDYQDVLERLENKGHKFYNRIYLPIKESMIEPVIEDARKTSLEIKYLSSDKPTRNLSNFHCQGCFYKDLCYAELRGLDMEYLLEAEFQSKDGGNG